MTAHTDKKKRKTVELPTQIEDNGATINLADLSLPELACFQETWKKKLADRPRVELELRAIHAAIRAKAK